MQELDQDCTCGRQTDRLCIYGGQPKLPTAAEASASRPMAEVSGNWFWTLTFVEVSV